MRIKVELRRQKEKGVMTSTKWGDDETFNDCTDMTYEFFLLPHSLSLSHTQTNTHTRTHTHSLSLSLTHTQTNTHTRTHTDSASLSHTYRIR